MQITAPTRTRHLLIRRLGCKGGIILGLCVFTSGEICGRCGTSPSHSALQEKSC
jgi:hypothetical protein